VRSRSRLVPGLLVVGIVLAGGGSVIAASGGSSSSGSSSKDQYCPQSSPGAGQPQGGPGNNCGNPPETCPDGSPKPPPGNCGHGGPNAASEGQKPPRGSNSASSGKPKPKKPKLYVHMNPKAGCVSRTLGARIAIANKPPRGVVTVLRDGRKLTTTKASVFKVHLNVRRLRRGAHTLAFRVRGTDGKLYTTTLRFRRC
jgi:hypothetical protein